MRAFLYCVPFCIVVPTLTLSETPPSLYELSAVSLEGEPAPLSSFRGKVSLVVNTASKCGYTPQYKELEALYRKFGPERFVVLGFPSNDFLNQEPGTGAEIRAFCERNFGVTFPLFEKAKVTGTDKQPVYRFLTETAPVDFRGDPGWNFVKFLVGCDGAVVNRFSSMTKPLSDNLVDAIEAALDRCS